MPGAMSVPAMITQGHLICVHSQALLRPGTVCDHCLPSVSPHPSLPPVPNSTFQPAHGCLISNRMTPVPGIQSPPHQTPISPPATPFTPGTLHAKSRHLISTHHQTSPHLATLRNPTHVLQLRPDGSLGAVASQGPLALHLFPQALPRGCPPGCHLSVPPWLAEPGGRVRSYLWNPSAHTTPGM